MYTHVHPLMCMACMHLLQDAQPEARLVELRREAVQLPDVPAHAMPVPST